MPHRKKQDDTRQHLERTHDLLAWSEEMIRRLREALERTHGLLEEKTEELARRKADEHKPIDFSFRSDKNYSCSAVQTTLCVW